MIDATSTEEGKNSRSLELHAHQSRDKLLLKSYLPDLRLRCHFSTIKIDSAFVIEVAVALLVAPRFLCIHGREEPKSFSLHKIY